MDTDDWVVLLMIDDAIVAQVLWPVYWVGDRLEFTIYIDDNQEDLEAFDLPNVTFSLDLYSSMEANGKLLGRVTVTASKLFWTESRTRHLFFPDRAMFAAKLDLREIGIGGDVNCLKEIGVPVDLLDAYTKMV